VRAPAHRDPAQPGGDRLALAGDPEVLSLTGQALGIEALAARYGVDVSS
jgi:hypothetical protein